MEIDLSRLDSRSQQVLDEGFRDDFHRNLKKALVAQTRTAARNANGTPWKGDFGPKLTEIDPLIDALWTAQYGHNYRENPDLMRWLTSRNAEIKGNARPGKVQVGYTGKTGCKFDRGMLEVAR